MLKKLFKLIIIILMIFGIVQGTKITLNRLFPNISLKKAEANIVSKMQSNNAELLEFYTYGKTLNIKGQIPRVSIDNIESVKLFITDGLEYERTYNLEYSVENNDLVFKSNWEENNGIIIDKLDNNVQYYLLLRLKLNNNVNPRFFSFDNLAEYNTIDYYTVTKNNKNRLAKIEYIEKTYKKNNYNFLTLSLSDSTLPEDVYDIVIDAGHGGKDDGVKKDGKKEADITLDYAYALKYYLETKGYKVKLTRDNENTDSYTYTNMYDENGRISIACKSKAKLMISFHINNGVNILNGFEIYCPPKLDIDFAKKVSNKIKEKSTLNYSNSNNYKKDEGVYLRNYSKVEISEMSRTAEKNGYEPYEITTDTPYLYTIREVGGLATGAYVDGRNKAYSKNEYYKSNQGIECYQIELGYVKTDLDILINEKDKIIEGIGEAIFENY